MKPYLSQPSHLNDCHKFAMQPPGPAQRGRNWVDCVVRHLAPILGHQ